MGRLGNEAPGLLSHGLLAGCNGVCQNSVELSGLPGLLHEDPDHWLPECADIPLQRSLHIVVMFPYVSLLWFAFSSLLVLFVLHVIAYGTDPGSQS